MPPMDNSRRRAASGPGWQIALVPGGPLGYRSPADAPILLQLGNIACQGYVFCIAWGGAVIGFLLRRLNRQLAAEGRMIFGC